MQILKRDLRELLSMEGFLHHLAGWCTQPKGVKIHTQAMSSEFIWYNFYTEFHRPLQARLASHNKRHLVITMLLLLFRTTSQNKKLLIVTIMVCPQRAGPLSGLNLYWDSMCLGCARLSFKKPRAGTPMCPKKVGTPNGFWITTDDIRLCALCFLHKWHPRNLRRARFHMKNLCWMKEDSWLLCDAPVCLLIFPQCALCFLHKWHPTNLRRARFRMKNLCRMKEDSWLLCDAPVCLLIFPQCALFFLHEALCFGRPVCSQSAFTAWCKTSRLWRLIVSM